MISAKKRCHGEKIRIEKTFARQTDNVLVAKYPQAFMPNTLAEFLSGRFQFAALLYLFVFSRAVFEQRNS